MKIKDFVELVKVSDIYKYKEFDRKVKSPKGQNYYQNLKNDIFKNGITNPITIQYSVIDSKLLVVEGNHRLAIAKELKIEYIPAYIEVVFNKTKIGKKVHQIPNSLKSIIYIKPSEFYNLETKEYNLGSIKKNIKNKTNGKKK